MANDNVRCCYQRGRKAGSEVSPRCFGGLTVNRKDVSLSGSFHPSPRDRNEPGEDGRAGHQLSLSGFMSTQKGAATLRLQTLFSWGLTGFNLKLTTCNSQLLRVLYIVCGLDYMCFFLVLPHPLLCCLCQGWEPRALCMLGKASIPELHPEFPRTLAFSGVSCPPVPGNTA